VEALIFIVIIAVVLVVLVGGTSAQRRRRPSTGQIVAGALLLGAVLAVIAWNEIQRWFRTQQLANPNTTGKLIRECLDRGDYSRVARQGREPRRPGGEEKNVERREARRRS
jgi:hypothetical protein